MKYFFILLLFLFMNITVRLWICNNLATVNKSDTCFYDIRVPADLDLPSTPHYDTAIVRKQNCSFHALRLPGWGTETRYTLLFFDTVKKTISLQAETHFHNGQRGILDITSLPPGNYSVNLAACGNGGGFTLKIK